MAFFNQFLVTATRCLLYTCLMLAKAEHVDRVGRVLIGPYRIATRPFSCTGDSTGALADDVTGNLRYLPPNDVEFARYRAHIFFLEGLTNVRCEEGGGVPRGSEFKARTRLSIIPDS